MTQADPNNPQVGDRFTYREMVVTITAVGLTRVLVHDGTRDYEFAQSLQNFANDFTPAPPMPPDRWGVMYDDGAVTTWSAKDTAENVKASERDTVLVHYVGTVVEP